MKNQKFMTDWGLRRIKLTWFLIGFVLAPIAIISLGYVSQTLINQTHGMLGWPNIYDHD